MKIWHFFMSAWIAELALTSVAVYLVINSGDCGEDEVAEPRTFLLLDLFFSSVSFLTAFDVFADKRREPSSGQAKRGMSMFIFVFAAVAATVMSSVAIGTLLTSCKVGDRYSAALYWAVAALVFDAVSTALAHASKRKKQPIVVGKKGKEGDNARLMLLKFNVT
tara:strand:- start:46 stop:537 length:492 start_codon:yes stop_codon:yes gene_type:complete